MLVNRAEESFLGLSANSIEVDASSLTLHQPIANITSSNQFLIKECFDDFALDNPDFKLVNLTKTFSWLIETGYYIPTRQTLTKIRHDYIPKPYPGIELKKRRELNLPPYSNHKAAANYYGALTLVIDYAIRAGSLISAAAIMQTSAESEKRQLYKRERAAMAIAKSINNNLSLDKQITNI
jgi:hypothetical protein